VAFIDDELIYRWTVEEYLRLVDHGRGQGTELVEGIIYDLQPETNLHNDAATAIWQGLSDRFPDHHVRFGGSVVVNDHSLWIPDVYVVRDIDPTRDHTPVSDLLLAVEVLLPTVERDTKVKVPAYAAAGVPECWIVAPHWDGPQRVWRYREPSAEGYRSDLALELEGPLDPFDAAVVLDA
jgi:Uma2 family endonuclease